jgi:hypothetical protein
MCLKVRPTLLSSRRPQPREDSEDGAVSKPLLVVAASAFRSAWARLAVSQLPRRTLLDLTPFRRAIPLASSGASSPAPIHFDAPIRCAFPIR